MAIQSLSKDMLGIITTDGCTAKCSHCIMNCKPGKKKKLCFEQIQECIDQVKKNISAVSFTGGEPTLLGDDLFRAIRYCSLNFLYSSLVTNAHWATSPERARKYIKKFRDAGLNEISFSIDDYHVPFVSIEKVKTAWDACKNVGFSAVVLANSHSKKDKIIPSYIKKFFGEKLLVSQAGNPNQYYDVPKDKDGTKYFIHENTLQKTGRAAEELDDSLFEKVKDQNSLMSPCHWAGSTPVLSPSGHLWACCGIPCENNSILDLGDSGKESIKKIISRARKDLLLNAIHYLGPLHLCRFVEAHSNVKFSKHFSDVCEICEALTKNKEAVDIILANAKEIKQQILAAQDIKETKKLAS